MSASAIMFLNKDLRISDVQLVSSLSGHAVVRRRDVGRIRPDRLICSDKDYV